MNRLKKVISNIMVSVLFLALILTFNACTQDSPMAIKQEVQTNSDAQDAGQFATSDVSAQSMLDEGPLSQEELDAITAPEEKVQIAEKDLKILKSKSGVSLQKQFVSSWYVPLGSYGWVYTGDTWHGKTWLYFPPYAMNLTTIITLNWESTGFLEGGVEFTPHGIQFNKPVTVWISYKDADLGNINEEDLRLWYFNNDTGMWELIGDVVDTENKMVGGLLHHFSRYAIGMD